MRRPHSFQVSGFAILILKDFRASEKWKDEMGTLTVHGYSNTLRQNHPIRAHEHGDLAQRVIFQQSSIVLPILFLGVDEIQFQSVGFGDC